MTQLSFDKNHLMMRSAYKIHSIGKRRKRVYSSAGQRNNGHWILGNEVPNELNYKTVERVRGQLTDL